MIFLATVLLFFITDIESIIKQGAKQIKRNRFTRPWPSESCIPPPYNLMPMSFNATSANIKTD